MKKNPLHHTTCFACALLLLTASVGCGKSTSTLSGQHEVSTSERTAASTTLPALTGKLVYHSYRSYGAVSKLYLYNFATNQLTWISQSWNIYDPMNAHFNNDGTKIVFMGEATKGGKWDIYLWTVGSTSAPVNLTAGDGCRDEDPKFSPNGTKICFKQTPAGGVGNLKIMDLNGVITNSVTNNTIESGMPYFTKDSAALLYARGAGSTSDIYMVNVDGTNDHALANVSGVQEYYPIVRDSATFLYTRWVSATNQSDQVYLGYFANNTRTSLPFNTTNADYSDAFPCDSSKVVLSCDKTGGSGAYDLYIADMTSGSMYSLSSYNTGINTSLNELGACYTK